MDPAKIVEALRQLDPANNEHWTENGAPRVEAVAELLGVKPLELKRAMITDAAPSLNRATHAEFVQAKDDPDEEEDEFSPPGPRVDPDDRSEHQERIAQLELELAEAERRAAQAQEEVRATTARLDAAREEMRRLHPPRHPVEVMKDHLTRLHEMRAAQHGAAPSPLDRALRARKRPQRTLPPAPGPTSMEA